jgi:hypothetical protein
VTYPDPKVAQLLEGFVCIRVDFDHEPDVVKKYGVKPLPDLRLLDSEGRELEKLLGFQSPERLSRACQRALDRIAGKPSAASETAAAPREVVVDDAAIAAAVARGRAFLAQEVEKGIATGGVPGLADEILFALVCAGAAADDAAVHALTTAVLKEELAGTYQVAFQALALARLDQRKHGPRLAECARHLESVQLAAGMWSYGKDATASADHSNSAYALLGLSACSQAGVEVSRDAVARAGRAWRAVQNTDGGWGYRKDRESDSYASMTESGIGALLCCRMLGAADPADAKAIENALAWVSAHFAVRDNVGSAYQQGRLLYHLYALERVGSLLGVTKIGTHDWFTEGASFLLGSQREDGSWDDGADMPVANTAFALLFLTKATRRA